MMKVLTVAAVSMALAATAAPIQVQARDGGAIAAGVLGGLAAGAIIGGAAAQPRPYYEPAPVYVAPPVYVEPEPRVCIEPREVWSNRYQGYVVRNVRVACY